MGGWLFLLFAVFALFLGSDCLSFSLWEFSNTDFSM